MSVGGHAFKQGIPMPLIILIILAPSVRCDEGGSVMFCKVNYVNHSISEIYTNTRIERVLCHLTDKYNKCEVDIGGVTTDERECSVYISEEVVLEFYIYGTIVAAVVVVAVFNMWGFFCFVDKIKEYRQLIYRDWSANELDI